AHHVPDLALLPVGGRPDRDDGRDGLLVIDPHLHTEASRLARTRADAEQVVVDGETLRLLRRHPLQAPRARAVQVAAGLATPVARDGLVAPAQVVDRGQVREEAEALLVAQVLAGLDEPRGIDDERRLAVQHLRLDQAGDAGVAHSATPR